MTSPSTSREDPEPFSWALYDHILEVALSCDYRFAGFDTLRLEPLPTGRYIFLRHDIDYSLAAVSPIARLEHDREVRATYCVQVDSPYYSLGSEEARRTIADLLAAGHWLGLHFDATRVEADDDEVARRVAAAANLLETCFGTCVDAVSFHMPTRRSVGNVQLHRGRLNLYSEQVVGRIPYVSDSNQHWRGTDLPQLLRAGEHEVLQVLTHPFWWGSNYCPLLQRLGELSRRVGVPLEDIVTFEQVELAAEPFPR